MDSPLAAEMGHGVRLICGWFAIKNAVLAAVAVTSPHLADNPAYDIAFRTVHLGWWATVWAAMAVLWAWALVAESYVPIRFAAVPMVVTHLVVSWSVLWSTLWDDTGAAALPGALVWLSGAVMTIALLLPSSAEREIMESTRAERS
jgi:hypothetical protein